MTDDRVVRLLTAAMHDEVAHEPAPPGLVEGVAVRRARRRRETFAVAGAAAAVLCVVGGGVLVANPSGPAPSAPAVPASASPSPAPSPASSPTASPVARARVEAASVPRGFRKSGSHGEVIRLADDTMGWSERVTYGRDFDARGRPRTTIAILTISGDSETIEPEDFRGSESGAVWVRVGGRRVVHVRDGLASGTLAVYQWTERPGVNVMVTGDGAVTDAEVRAVVASARLV